MHEKLNTDDKDSVDEIDSRLSKAFASALSDELDAVGFVSGIKRGREFAAFMGLGRLQASRVLNAGSTLALRKLCLFRHLGVSLDRIFDKSSDVKPVVKTVYLNGVPVSACVQTGVSRKLCGAALIPHGTGYELIAVKSGTELSRDAIPIRDIKFDTYDRIAIIEDDSNLLEMLDSSMSSAFLTAPFPCAKRFLDELTRQDTFKAILMDWRLPDMTGEDLIARIRQKTNAPIYILTGDTTAAKSIERALSYEDIYYAAKPIGTELLIKLLSNAIRSADIRR